MLESRARVTSVSKGHFRRIMNKKKEESYVEREKRKKAGAPARKAVRNNISKKISEYPIFKGK